MGLSPKLKDDLKERKIEENLKNEENKKPEEPKKHDDHGESMELEEYGEKIRGNMNYYLKGDMMIDLENNIPYVHSNARREMKMSNFDPKKIMRN